MKKDLKTELPALDDIIKAAEGQKKAGTSSTSQSGNDPFFVRTREDGTFLPPKRTEHYDR